MFAFEVAGDELGAVLGGAQVGTGVADQFVLGAGAAAAERVRLDVLVEQLGRVELGAVPGQELEFDLLGVRRDPLTHLGCAVHRVAVEDQDDLLPVGLADQASEEVEQYRRGEALREDAELKAALVGDRRDHVRAEA